MVVACQAIRRANKGHRNPQREWLISRLCGIWLDNFHAERLTVTVGGQPGGPLINFLLAAMRQIMRQARSAARRERCARRSIANGEAARTRGKHGLDLRQRAPMVVSTRVR